MELVELNTASSGISKVPEGLKEHADLSVGAGIFDKGGEGEGTGNGRIIEACFGR